MAKRGYRGKHPHNDMKVSPKNPSSGKHNAKLTTEYNNLPDKQKYSYIRTNYFYPQATITISASRDFEAGSQITMSSADGTVVKLLGAAATSAGDGEFKADGSAAEATNGLVSCINTLAGSKFTATTTGTPAEQLLVTQDEPGIDGNTTVTFVKVNQNVIIGGVAANLSGSGTYKFSGG